MKKTYDQRLHEEKVKMFLEMSPKELKKYLDGTAKTPAYVYGFKFLLLMCLLFFPAIVIIGVIIEVFGP